MKRVAGMLSRQALPLGVAAAAFTVAVGLPSSDPDMWWHLASGHWMLDHRDVLRVEIFSSTAAGTPYAVGEWLGQIVLAGAHAAAGWVGIAVLRAALVALAAFSLTRIALRAARRRMNGDAPPAGHVGTPAVTRDARAAAVVAVALVAIALALSKIAWTDRPGLFTLALFPVLLDLLLTARSGTTRALFAVPPLLFLWSDLHGGYALGLAIAIVFAGDAALRRRHASAFAVAAVAAAAVVLANPGAIGVLPATAHVATAPRAIVEESPPDVLTPAGATFALFVIGTFAALLLRGGPVLAPLLLVPLLWLGLSAQRHMIFFVFASVPFLVDAIALAPAAAAFSPSSRPDRWRAGIALDLGPATPTRSGSRRRFAAAASAGMDGDPRQRRALAPGIAVALWVGALISITTAPTTPDESLYPKAAIPALRASSGVLLHEYDWGGYLIWSAPDRPVFVDGRLVPYLPDVVDEHRRAIALRPGWREVLYRHAVAQVLLEPTRPLAGALREDGWRVVAEGDGFVLLERPR